MSVKFRLIQLVKGGIPVAVIYILTSLLVVPNWIVPEIYIDSIIPFNPVGIWLYISMYVYIPYAFINARWANVQPMSFAFVLCGVCSGFIFILLPSTIEYPTFTVDSLSSQCLNFVTQHDTSQNCFPSLHGSLLTICTLGLWKENRYARNLSHVIITLFMYYSIIQVRRHVFIDLATGIFIGFIAFWISSQFLDATKSE